MTSVSSWAKNGLWPVFFACLGLVSSYQVHAGYIFVNQTWLYYDSSKPIDIHTPQGNYTVHPDGRVVAAQLATTPKSEGMFASQIGGGGESLFIGKHDDIIQKHASANGLDASLVKAIIHQESRYDSNAVSHKGAQGLMQLIPATAQRLNVTRVFDPEDNIRGGTRYLRILLDKFNNDAILAIAAYNAGEGSVAKYRNTIPPYPETQKYVKRVLGLWSQYSMVSKK